MAFLAPRIVAAILEGRQPADLTAIGTFSASSWASNPDIAAFSSSTPGALAGGVTVTDRGAAHYSQGGGDNREHGWLAALDAVTEGKRDPERLKAIALTAIDA